MIKTKSKIEYYKNRREMTTVDSVSDLELPCTKTLSHAARIGIMDDKPIMLDYWADSIHKKVFIGIKDNQDKEKLLVKSEDEYTSPIDKIFKIDKSYIIVTENSIYIVKSDITNRKIS